MEFSLDPSVEEEEEDLTHLDIVISEVCSVLEAEQEIGRVMENPMYSEDSGSEQSTDNRDSHVSDKDELENSSGRTSVENISCDCNDPSPETAIKDPLSISSRSRSVSSCIDDSPNQGLCDDEVQSDGCAGNKETREIVRDDIDQVGALVWAKMKGYPPWPAIVVPDPASGRSKEWKKGGQWRHVLFLEYRNEVAWLPLNQLKLFSSKEEGKVKKGNKKTLVKAVELAKSLNNMECWERLQKFTEYQHSQGLEKRNTVEQEWTKLSMTPIVKLKRVNVCLKPVVMLKRIRIDNDQVADLIEYDEDYMLDDSDDDNMYTNVKSPSPSSSDSDTSEWCEGMLVWARVQGYPFWPAVIVREQKSDEFSIPSKTGLVRIHVMFLAFHNQTALVGETSLVPFHSPDQFKHLLSSPNKKLQKDFLPSKSLAPKFNLAVKTAQELLPESLYNRLEHLYT